MIRQLRQLGDLHAQGLLTDAEFAVQKSPAPQRVSTATRLDAMG